jgi:lipopolysaccharide transport system ATP-binding protein
MSDVVIHVEDVSKQYRLGQVGRKTINQDVNRWWSKVRGKEDPYLKIGEENDRAKKGSSEYIWALRNINFEVKGGEVLGIVGRNGAGKSTLLKILSKVTSPTTGEIKIKGRIASLLEVGTGFHPDLSGRDNIFLNGAILGMTRKEIQSKFDEIVDFAGVERYIDTPVKRYSSGMYVRLAFAVAAHLEPDILIVDEVLAVGDAEFQKKCLGKMKEVSVKDGRTVLFVSHNMTAIKTLCTNSIWFENGLVKKIGETNSIVDKYLSNNFHATNKREIDCSINKNYSNENIKFLKVAIESKNEIVRVNDAFAIYFEFECLLENADLNMSIVLYTMQEVCVFNSGSKVLQGEKGIFYARCFIPAEFLNDEFYKTRILVVKDSSTALIDIDNIISFEVQDKERDGNWYGKWIGIIRPQLNWEFAQLKQE